nr:uncharacterized protein LOC127339705 [Lolium perenne]
MNVYRGDKAMATHWGIMQTACSKWHGIQEEVEERPISGHDLEQKLRRALDMYTDDTGMQFKFLNVYARLENCEKWKETRTTLSKSKTEQYNPDAPAAGAAEGRLELGQKKLKELKKTGNPADRMQASIDKCRADLRTHADGRNDKFDGRWREMLANQGVRIALLKTTTAAKKRNTNLAFLMGGGNMELMGEETRNCSTADSDASPHPAQEPPPPVPVLSAVLIDPAADDLDPSTSPSCSFASPRRSSTLPATPAATRRASRSSPTTKVSSGAPRVSLYPAPLLSRPAQAPVHRGYALELRRRPHARIAATAVSAASLLSPRSSLGQLGFEIWAFTHQVIT